jgi:hypothetical protein
LARKTDSLYALLPNQKETIVLCDNYGQAGAINYYTKKGIKAVSFNADYLNWFDLTIKYKNLIRVKDFEENDKEMKETSPYFESAVIGGQVTNQYARGYGATIFIFKNAKVDINKRLEQEINEEKSDIIND